MIEQIFYPQPIQLSRLKSGVINIIDIDREVYVIAIKLGDKLEIIEDICPHMGGLLSQGKYCPKTNTLQCSWHGYIFDLETHLFKENPNEEIWEKLRYPTKHFTPGKTPKYKLSLLAYEIRGDEAYVYRKGNLS
jgi:nitrite reductase/ring-hydroxylating ferredoxin subunit